MGRWRWIELAWKETATKWANSSAQEEKKKKKVREHRARLDAFHPIKSTKI
jgi:hypothetical protein